jgi:hypothetical protein
VEGRQEVRQGRAALHQRRQVQVTHDFLPARFRTWVYFEWGSGRRRVRFVVTAYSSFATPVFYTVGISVTLISIPHSPSQRYVERGQGQRGGPPRLRQRGLLRGPVGQGPATW